MPASLARVVRRGLTALKTPALDAELLRRYTRTRDPDAFAELVARHGPVVLGVCRRVLGRSPDVDDAFQAAFLVLARNARAVRDPARLPGWLHRVALRAARRALARRRPALPLEAAAGAGAAADTRDLSWREGLATLDEELNALPDRLRTPLVLCYLDGLTRDEAAVRLGWSVAMLKRRLEEGRGRLRARLLRRGVSAAVLAAASTQADGLRASVPPKLLSRAAGLPAGPVPDAVHALAHGLSTRCTPAVAAQFFLVFGLAVTGLVAIGLLTAASAETPAKEGGSAPVPAKDAARPEPPRSREPALPAGAVARLGSLRFRTPDGSNGSALSADGKLLATAHKTTVAVWDVETGERKHIFRNCGIPDGFGAGTKVALSPDGTLLAHRSESEVLLRVWDLTTGKQVATVGTTPVLRPGPGGVAPAAPAQPDAVAFSQFAFSADGKELVLCGPSGARFLEARTGKELRKTAWSGEPQYVSPDGRFCVTASGRPTVTAIAIRDTATGKSGPEFSPSAEAVYGSHVALSADGKRGAFIARGATVHVWDAATGKELCKFEHPKPDPRGQQFLVPAFSPDARILYVSCSQPGVVRRYDLDARKELPELGGHNWWVTGVHPTPDGKRLISAGWDGRVRRFDLTTGAELESPGGYDRSAGIAGTAEGRLIAVAGWNGRLDVYDYAGRLVRTLQEKGQGLQRLAFSPDGRTLAAWEQSGRIRLWAVADWSEAGALVPGPAATGRYASSLHFSPDSRRLLTAVRDDGLRCWDVPGRKEVWYQPTKSGDVAAFSPDGRLVLSGGWDQVLAWRNPHTGEVIRRQSVTEATGNAGSMYVNRIAFAPDGRSFLTTHHDATVRRWDTDTGKLLASLKGHQEVTWWAKFSPDGKWIASGSVDRTVRIWEAASGAEVHRLYGHDAWVMDGLWGGGGKTLLTTAGSDVLLWSLRPADVKPPTEVASLWGDLAAEPGKAYRAQWALLEDPKAAARLFRDRQPAEKAPGDEKPIRQLIADLDSDTFRTREQAMKALRDLGKPVVPYLRTAQGNAPAEAAKRLGELLAELTQAPTPNDLRQMRAVQVLELAGTPEAKAVLEVWAGGQSGVLLTDEAAAALKRMDGRR